ncbi:hypothetical protein PG993_008138 [Apiospora rasikravindrae]|uniref:Uncharacterized protein n=1 Tax=Apiospora rasikravindrae TaxID=990691 RepID=A0ABR1SZU9_9PEZI
MQFTRVNPRSDLALDMTIKPPVRANGRTRPSHLPKSLPPDPEDLRRRLYIVLSEQNAQREARRLRAQNASGGASWDPSRAGSSAGGDIDASVTSVYTRKSATSFAARAAATTAGTTAPGLRVVIAPPRADACGRDQNLRRADSKLEPATAAKDVKRSKSSSSKAKRPATPGAAQEEQPPSEPYHHVPQVAAQQFARTATAKASLCDMSNVHPLSRQALKFHIEGSAAERTELESSKTPGEQNRALRRAQSTREKLQGRNQFQDEALPTGAAAVATAIPAARNKRHSLPADGFAVYATGGPMRSSPPDNRNHINHNWNWANMGDIVEDSPLNTNNDDQYNYQTGEFSPAHHQTSNNSSYHRRQRSLSFADLLPGGRSVDVDGEPLVVRNRATGADRRADWAQKDEKDQKLSRQHSNSNNSKVPRSPLLRKADSLWALKTKLVSSSKLHLNNSSSSGNSSSNKSRNSANSCETGTTTSPIKSPSRGGFFARLRRLS